MYSRLAPEKSYPCVIYKEILHRTHADNTIDAIGFNNLLKEAIGRVSIEFCNAILVDQKDIKSLDDMSLKVRF